MNDKSTKVVMFKPRRPAERIVRCAGEERVVGRLARSERRYFAGSPDGRFAHCACGRRERA
jgi:hypothetical protein